MALEIEGLDQFKLMLKRAGDLPADLNHALKAKAHLLHDLAVAMAPIEYGDLKASIQLRETAAQGKGGRFEKGLRNYTIFIDNNYPVSDERQRSGGAEVVGDYAWFVHEYMGWAGHPGAPIWNMPDGFMPSEASVQEGLLYGVDAGGMFLTRAADEVSSELPKFLGSVMFKFIESLDI